MTIVHALKSASGTTSASAHFDRRSKMPATYGRSGSRNPSVGSATSSPAATTGTRSTQRQLTALLTPFRIRLDISSKCGPRDRGACHTSSRPRPEAFPAHRGRTSDGGDVQSTTPELHSIAATTHGRVLVRPARGATSRGVLAGFHGYSETAAIQLARLEAIPGAAAWTLVSVQALHRFYRGRAQEVGASWMT